MPVRDAGFAKDLVRRYLNDVFSRGDFGSIDHYLAGEKFTSGVVDLVTRWRTAFPDLRIEVQDVIVEGDKVVTEEKMTGTHIGAYRSTSTGLSVDATGREVTWTRLAVRTLRDDRFVDGFWEEDEVGLLQQLGVLEAPAAEDLRDLAAQAVDEADAQPIDRDTSG